MTSPPSYSKMTGYPRNLRWIAKATIIGNPLTLSTKHVPVIMTFLSFPITNESNQIFHKLIVRYTVSLKRAKDYP